MSGALFWTTLRLSRWAIVAWALFLTVYGVFILYLFPSVRDIAGYEDLIRSMPEGVRSSMGLSEGIMSEFFKGGSITFQGYLSTEYFTWWPVIGGIYAFMFGSGIVAREVERGTMELLLSQPVSRSLVLTSKFLAFLAIVGILAFFSLLGVALGLFTVDEELSMARVFLVTLQGSMAITTIAAYSLLLSTVFLDPRKAMAVAGGLMAIFYILNLLGPALHSWSWLQKLSIFYYFQPLEIMLRGSFAISSVLVYVGLTTVCFTAALVVFQRRKAVV